MSSNLEISCPVSQGEISEEDTIVSTLNNPWQLENIIYDLQTKRLEPELLIDNSRLQEIYELRVSVWEHSGKTEFVNSQLFPNGWFDELDETALHWIIVNDQDKIIASARLNIFNSLDEFPYYPSMKHLSFPTTMPFAFYSRLVIHPEYRGNGLSRQLVTSRMLFCETKKISWLQVFINNQHVINLFKKLDCKIIGQAEVSYNKFSQPHSVNVLIKEYNYGKE